MYFVKSRIIDTENGISVQFGIADCTKEYVLFTESEHTACALASLLNKNGVAPEHIADIVEDMFYT